MITYADLIQFCIFIVALIGLFYQILRDRKGQKKIAATTCDSDGITSIEVIH